MTRKDYILIAAALKQGRQHVLEHESTGFAIAVNSIADALSRDNPRFDRAKFINATID